ncbi:hypothetical protein HYC85_028520 [Camellia sinensis]|uniref:Uncharacterized protein n=1 Tax=Camellia sinensis TaxID=4442 RepID=A0A7J7FVN5_CAMSI|nr:hypothetical protein HYC85_028520 [Camellia sinensis]
MLSILLALKMKEEEEEATIKKETIGTRIIQYKSSRPLGSSSGLTKKTYTDEEVAGLFNKIAKNMVPDTNAYKDVQNQIEKHYKNKVRLWMIEWLHTHFDTPWTILRFPWSYFSSCIELYSDIYCYQS